MSLLIMCCTGGFDSIRKMKGYERRGERVIPCRLAKGMGCLLSVLSAVVATSNVWREAVIGEFTNCISSHLPNMQKQESIMACSTYHLKANATSQHCCW